MTGPQSVCRGCLHKAGIANRDFTGVKSRFAVWSRSLEIVILAVDHYIVGDQVRGINIVAV